MRCDVMVATRGKKLKLFGTNIIDTADGWLWFSKLRDPHECYIHIYGCMFVGGKVLAVEAADSGCKNNIDRHNKHNTRNKTLSTFIIIITIIDRACSDFPSSEQFGPVQNNQAQYCL